MSSGGFTRGDLCNMRRCGRGYMTNFRGVWLGLLLVKGSSFSSSIWTLDKVSVILSIAMFFGEAFTPFTGDSDAILVLYLKKRRGNGMVLRQQVRRKPQGYGVKAEIGLTSARPAPLKAAGPPKFEHTLHATFHTETLHIEAKSARSLQTCNKGFKM